MNLTPIARSDQGVQYTCKAYQKDLRDAGLIASMSRKGMPYDNAVMESFFASLKQELTHHEQFKDRDEARTRVFDYIEVFDKPRAIAQRAGQPLTRRLRRAGGV